MQKVVYGVSRVNRDEKLKGIGYLIDGNLFVPATSQKGNLYIRIFEGVGEKCKPVPDRQNEYKGYVDVIYTDVPVFKSTDHDSDESKEGSYEILDSVTITYYVWYKKIKCGYCGRPISADTGTARNGEVIHYYKCIGRKVDHNGCTKTVVNKEFLEELIINTVIEELSKPNIINKIVKELLKIQDRQITEKREHSIQSYKGAVK